MNLIKRISCRIPLLLLCLGMVAAMGARAGEGAAPAEAVVAMVNGNPVTAQEYNAEYSTIIRNRYYHGAPPEAETEAVRKEVMDLLIENLLLVEEAERRGLKPDEAKFEQVAADIETRYGALPEWQKDREQVLSRIKEQIRRQSLAEQAKKVLRDVPPPSPAEVRAYYDQKPELFTEPEKLSLSVILLSVDPSAPIVELAKAHEEAQRIYLRLKEGADFAELARQYSGDSSAGEGGKLGYVHGGMLPENLQEKISAYQIGAVTEPIRTLEGVALYRVDDRVAPVLRDFADVEPRVTELLKRDQVERAWKEAIGRLRADAKIEILVPLGGDAAKQDAAKQDADKKKAGKKKTL